MDIINMLAVKEQLQAVMDGRRGVMVGDPFVVELCDGLYLCADNERGGFQPGAILDHVACYSPDRVGGAVEHIRAAHGDVFSGARAVRHDDALVHELHATERIISMLQARQ